jgi:superfamily I DNA/RNA helicase/Zn-dependent peptidase ImmA (M78 family)
MDVPVRVEAIEAARDLLRRFQAIYPAWQDDLTPLEDIAGWLGCEIATFHPEDHAGGTYGFLEPGEPLIWLCRDLPTTLRRFTLAHELGHVVLHSHLSIGHDLPAGLLTQVEAASASPDDPCHDQDVCEELTGLLSQEHAEEVLGPGLAYDPRSQRELAANLFAAELLMPLERVHERYVVHGQTPDLLAGQFGVSLAAMLNRLAGLLTRPVPSGSQEDGETREIGSAALRPAGSPRAYDQFQQAAIEAATPALVVAGPGSGKTSTLIGRAEYLIKRQGVPPEAILALTFSRKAAREMQERLQHALPADLLLPTISTFHAFCAEVLRTHGPRVGLRESFALVDDAEGYFLLQSLAGLLPLNHYQNLQNPAAPFRDFLKAISRAKDELVNPARYRELALAMRASAQDEESTQAGEKALEVAAIYELYQQGLQRRGDCDFGGLIGLTVQLLREYPEVQAEIAGRYQHILVDEFQDINRASGVLLRLLAGEQQRVWVVGDMNQAIYGFRGASPANIANFHEDYPRAVVLPLNCNYRSRPDIVRLASAFKRAHLEQDAHADRAETAREEANDAYITLAVAPDEVSELHGLVHDIQGRLEEGYRCADIAVLCRTRAMTRKVTRELARAGLPVGARGGGLLEQEHSKNLLSLLLLIADPGGMGILRAARLPAHPLGQADIEALLLEARARQTSPLTIILREEPPPTMSAEGGRALARLAALMQTLVHSNGSVWSLLARYLLQETSMGRDLLADERPDACAARQDYAALLQLAHSYDQRCQEALHQREEQARERGEEPAPAPDIQAQIRDFLEYLQILLSLRQEGEGRREESGAESAHAPEVLRVMTVHASKGLEFPIVYLPGLSQRRFPLQKRHNPAPPPGGMLPVAWDGDAAHESGEACLFYVGTTRARDQLILSHSERYGKQTARRSGYIDALVAGLPEERVRHVQWPQAGASPEHAGAEAALSVQPSQSFSQVTHPPRLTARQIEDYQICPRRYLYGTIYAFRHDDGAFLPFWQTTHATLQTLVQRMSGDEQALSREEVNAIFKLHWQTHGGANGPFAQLYQRHGEDIVEQVWKQLQTADSSEWRLRQRLTIDLAGQKIDVTIDRVEAATTGSQPARLVRTRFARKGSKPAAGTRELLYMHAGRQHQVGGTIALQTHNLSSGETHNIRISTRKEQSLMSELERALAGIEQRDFTPRPDAYTCATCPFFLICPA